MFLMTLGLIFVFGNSPSQQSAEEIFERAFFYEDVQGDLQKAIGLYEQILKQFPDNRETAAKAQLRIGICYEKLGRSEARNAYQKVIDNFPRQIAAVREAREKLAALQSGPSAAPPASRDSNLVIRRVPNFDMYAKPSPDGKYIASVDWETGNLAIWDTATGAKRLLTKDASWRDENEAYAGFCIWSHDNKRIAYMWDIYSPQQSGTELRVISANGESTPTTIPVPESLGVNWLWDWSTDNSRLLCGLTGDRGRTTKMALIDVRNHAIEYIDPGLSPGNWGGVQFVDRNSIIYSRPTEGPGTPFDIYHSNLKTGRTTTLVEHPSEDLVVGVLPGSDWLLFASDRRNRLDLWAVPFRDGKTTGPPVLLKSGIGRFLPLGFSGDDRYYYAIPTVTDDIFFADLDPEAGQVVGQPRKLVSPWEGTNMDPSFSPDGEFLAYITNRSPLPSVHTANTLVVQSLKDTQADPVVVGFADLHVTRVAWPQWEAGGKSLVLAGERGDLWELYRVDLTTLKKEKVYSPPEGYYINSHQCARQTGFIYLLQFVEQEMGTVLRTDSDGTNPREVCEIPKGAARTLLTLSPDEKTLAFVTRLDAERRQLQVVPSSGGVPRIVHEFAQAVSHAWSPDGKSIFYMIRNKDTGLREVYRIPADGGHAIGPTILEYSTYTYGLALHPNGRLLAFCGRNGASSAAEVWVMENLKEELAKLAPETGKKRATSPVPSPSAGVAR